MHQLAVVAPLRPMKVAANFPRDDLPLHLTLLPIVRVKDADSAGELQRRLTQVTTTLTPIESVVADEEWFGPQHDVLVFVLGPAPAASRAHEAFLAAATEVSAEPVEPQYTGPGFRPHITRARDSSMLRLGQRLLLTEVAILDCTAALVRVCSVSPWTCLPFGDVTRAAAMTLATPSGRRRRSHCADSQGCVADLRAALRSQHEAPLDEAERCRTATERAWS